MACLRICKVTLVAFVWLFSTVRFQMCPQISCMRRGIVALVAFVWFFSAVPLKLLHKRMQIHIGFIFLTFLHCVISNASSNGLYLKIHSRIGCIYATQRQYFSSGFSHLHPPNQDNNQDFAPLPLLCLFFPNCCFKLSQIYHWLFVSNNHNCLLSITYFHFFII